MGSGLLLFLGNGEVGINYTDNTYPFRQDSTFLYFFGISQPGVAAIIDIDEDREVVFGDELTIDDIVWTGAVPTVTDICHTVGVEETLPLKQLASYLDRSRSKGQKIHFLPPYRADHRI